MFWRFYQILNPDDSPICLPNNVGGCRHEGPVVWCFGSVDDMHERNGDGVSPRIITPARLCLALSNPRPSSSTWHACLVLKHTSRPQARETGSSSIWHGLWPTLHCLPKAGALRIDSVALSPYQPVQNLGQDTPTTGYFGHENVGLRGKIRPYGWRTDALRTLNY